MTETWKPIPGFEELYAVSASGKIKSLRNGRIMSPGSGADGYPIVSLYRAAALASSQQPASTAVGEDAVERPTLDEPWDYVTLRDAYLELADKYVAARPTIQPTPLIEEVRRTLSGAEMLLQDTSPNSLALIKVRALLAKIEGKS